MVNSQSHWMVAFRSVLQVAGRPEGIELTTTMDLSLCLDGVNLTWRVVQATLNIEIQCERTKTCLLLALANLRRAYLRVPAIKEGIGSEMCAEIIIFLSHSYLIHATQ